MHRDTCAAPKKYTVFCPKRRVQFYAVFGRNLHMAFFHVRNVFYDTFVAPELKPAPNSVIKSHWQNVRKKGEARKKRGGGKERDGEGTTLGGGACAQR